MYIKSEEDVLEILERFKQELRGIDFNDPVKQQKYSRLRSYIDALIGLLDK